MANKRQKTLRKMHRKMLMNGQKVEKGNKTQTAFAGKAGEKSTNPF